MWAEPGAQILIAELMSVRVGRNRHGVGKVRTNSAKLGRGRVRSRIGQIHLDAPVSGQTPTAAQKLSSPPRKFDSAAPGNARMQEPLKKEGTSQTPPPSNLGRPQQRPPSAPDPQPSSHMRALARMALWCGARARLRMVLGGAEAEADRAPALHDVPPHLAPDLCGAQLPAEGRDWPRAVGRGGWSGSNGADGRADGRAVGRPVEQAVGRSGLGQSVSRTVGRSVGSGRTLCSGDGQLLALGPSGGEAKGPRCVVPPCDMADRPTAGATARSTEHPTARGSVRPTAQPTDGPPRPADGPDGISAGLPDRRPDGRTAPAPARPSDRPPTYNGASSAPPAATLHGLRRTHDLRRSHRLRHLRRPHVPCSAAPALRQNGRPPTKAVLACTKAQIVDAVGAAAPAAH